MRFDEIRAIWDSQSERRVFTVEAEALSRAVRRRSSRLRWAVTFEEFLLVAICIFFPAINGFYSGEHAYETVGAVVFAGVALFMLWHRFQRIRRERGFDDTMLGELERAIHRVDCQIWRARHFAWWFLLPSVLYSALSMSQHFTWTGFVAALIGYPAAFLAVQLAWRFPQSRERRSLAALRAELLRTLE